MYRLLRWLTGTALADAIAGDLVEERRRRAGRSAVGAALWFGRASAAIAAHVAVRRMGEALVNLGRAFRPGRGRGEWRQAFRSLRRAPWYSLTIAGVIALSIALATTVFAIVDGVLFKPLPYRDAHELYRVTGPDSRAKSIAGIRRQAAAVADITLLAYQGTWEIGALGESRPRPIRGTAISEDFFDFLGQRPLMGGFQPEHFTPTTSRVPVLVSHRLWLQRFGGRTEVIGEIFDLPGAEDHMGRPFAGFQVVGVLPRELVFPDPQDTPDLLLPIALTPEEETSRNYSFARTLARIPADVALDGVARRLEAAARADGEDAPTGSIRLNQLDEYLVRQTYPAFRTAFAAVTALLLLTALNVTSLGMARGRQRLRELAVRRAIGAGPAHLFRLGLVETMPLVAAGVALGLASAPVLLRFTLDVMQSRQALLKTPSIDWRVAGLAALCSLLLLLAIVCRWSRGGGRQEVGAAMGRGQSVTPRSLRWVRLTVAWQVALALVLTVGGTLLVGSLWWAWRQDPGFTYERAAVIQVSTGSGTSAERQARLAELAGRIDALPEVEYFATVLGPASFLTRGWMPLPSALDGRDRDQVIAFTGDFFSIVGLRPIAGRLPRSDEVAGNAPVAVVSERVARWFWPDESGVGQSLTLPRTSYHVVGVVEDARFGGLDDTSHGQLYIPAANPGETFLVRGRASAEAAIAAVMRAVDAGGGRVGVTRAETFDQAFAELLRRRAGQAWMYGSFAASALVIVVAGVLGLVAMSTAVRARELGVRAALGASRRRLLRQMLGEQLVSVCVGVAAGAVIASWAVGYVRASLYAFTPYDWRLWSLAGMVILASGLLGTLIPALRASRADPANVLRAE